jgi:hypothetical protein
MVLEARDLIHSKAFPNRLSAIYSVVEELGGGWGAVLASHWVAFFFEYVSCVIHRIQ